MPIPQIRIIPIQQRRLGWELHLCPQPQWGGYHLQGTIFEPRIDSAIARTSALNAHTSNTNNPLTGTSQVGAVDLSTAQTGGRDKDFQQSDWVYSCHWDSALTGLLNNDGDELECREGRRLSDRRPRQPLWKSSACSVSPVKHDPHNRPELLLGTLLNRRRHGRPANDLFTSRSSKTLKVARRSNVACSSGRRSDHRPGIRS